MVGWAQCRGVGWQLASIVALDPRTVALLCFCGHIVHVLKVCLVVRRRITCSNSILVGFRRTGIVLTKRETMHGKESKVSQSIPLRTAGMVMSPSAPLASPFIPKTCRRANNQVTTKKSGHFETRGLEVHHKIVGFSGQTVARSAVLSIKSKSGAKSD